ncbi:MAG TPA: UvrD-helicase domain-containing protein [Candidatus Limnocylindrales bacterium]|nr:UvrD-helicase domain-containing protein [Candidatus Limnocylindrales bacterium]
MSDVVDMLERAAGEAARVAAGDMVADHESRMRALSVDSSVVVQAPAGSGKTELLVQRFLALLATVERPEAILAITFTRKAAAEMRERILEALRGAERGDPPRGPSDAQRLQLARAALEHGRRWKLAENPSRLQVYTIDSLCARLAASMPLLSRLGGVPETVEDATPLYREAARRCLYGDAREQDAGLAHCIDLVLERVEMGVSGLEARLVDMLSRREQWTHVASAVLEQPEPLLARIEDGFAAALGDCTRTLALLFPETLRELAHEVARRTRHALQGSLLPCNWPTLGESALLSAGPESTAAWGELRALLMTRTGLRKPSGLNVNVGAADSAVKTCYTRLLDEVQALPTRQLEKLLADLSCAPELPAAARFSGESRDAMLALLRVLLLAHQELWLVFRERRMVDFVQVAAGAVSGLGSTDAPSELLQRLDARISHLLVDEFQDTNLVQCELVARLTSAWTPGDGRTLFLVGDPMQSIYRFRKAEVGLFLRAFEGRLFDHVAAEPVRLQVNFRSDRSVLAWINRVFAGVLGDVDDARRGLVRFAPSVARPGAADGEPVRIYSWRAVGDADDKGKGEARGLADLITADLLPQARTRGGKVAILVRSRSHALPLLAELRGRGIRYRAPGFDMLANRATVSDLAALTRAIVHPADRLSWLAVLRSPMVGLEIADLLRLFEPEVEEARARADHAPPRLVAAVLRDAEARRRVLGDDACARVEKAQAVLSCARARLGAVPVDRVVRSAWIAMGGPACADAEGLLDAEQFFALVPGCTQRATLDLDDLERRLQTLEASVDPDPAIDLEVMTIHKAKGLQFDTVVLPRLDGTTRGRTPEAVTMETDAATGHIELMAMAPARGRTDEDEEKRYKLLERRERERDAAELRRMLYVAATRAEHRLVLSATAPAEGKPARRATAMAVLEPFVGSADIVTLDCPPVLGPLGRPSMRLAAGYEPAPPVPRAQPRTVVVQRPSEAGAEELDPAQMSASMKAIHIGKVTHAAVERITEDGVDAWTAARVRAERGWIERRLRMAGAVEEELRECARAVEEALVALLEDERGRWLLAPHQDARTELPLTGLQPQAVTVASIDRTFIEEGVRWIIDLKTGRPDGREYRGLSEDEAARRYVEARTAEYATQLEQYRKLIELAAGAHGDLPERGAQAPVRLGLFFARLPAAHRWREITTPSDRSQR